MIITIKDIDKLTYLLNDNSNEPIYIEGLTIKDSTPELLLLLKRIRYISTNTITINTSEDLTTASMRLAAIKQYDNVIIRNNNRDIRIS